MSPKKCKKCRRQEALHIAIINDWNKLNVASKMLLFVGLIFFILNVFITLVDSFDSTLMHSIEVILRTSMSSIFGFFLSSNMTSKKKDLKDIKYIDENKSFYRDDNKTSTSSSSDEPKYNECGCLIDIKRYNYDDGNLIRLSLAFFIAVSCILVLCFAGVFNLVSNITAVGHIRDLMCSSIGFLLGESRIK